MTALKTASMNLFHACTVCSDVQSGKEVCMGHFTPHSCPRHSSHTTPHPWSTPSHLFKAGYCGAALAWQVDFDLCSYNCGARPHKADVGQALLRTHARAAFKSGGWIEMAAPSPISLHSAACQAPSVSLFMSRVGLSHERRASQETLLFFAQVGHRAHCAR